MMVKFEIVDRHDNRTVFEFGVGTYMLGKGDKCDVILNDNHVSRNHAKIEVTPHAAVLSDLGRTNGTWSKGARLAAPLTLSAKDVVNFGELKLVVLAVPANVIDELGGFDRRPIRAFAKQESEALVTLK